MCMVPTVAMALDRQTTQDVFATVEQNLPWWPDLDETERAWARLHLRATVAKCLAPVPAPKPVVFTKHDTSDKAISEEVSWD